jgi:hypothetical protein
MEREVTELDFRLPEYRNAKIKDYEWRADGKLVRKDRWESGIHSIAEILGLNKREGFEIDDIVEAVRILCPELIEEDESTSHPLALSYKDDDDEDDDDDG